MKDISIEELNHATDQFSPALLDAIAERADMTAANWLFNFDLPKTAAQVRTLVRSVYQGGVSALLVEDFIALTDEGQATEEQVEQAQQDRQRRESFTAAMQERLTTFPDSGSEGQLFSPGQYL